MIRVFRPRRLVIEGREPVVLELHDGSPRCSRCVALAEKETK